jgi:hypothetical protein
MLNWRFKSSIGTEAIGDVILFILPSLKAEIDLRVVRLDGLRTELAKTGEIVKFTRLSVKRDYLSFLSFFFFFRDKTRKDAVFPI